MAAIKGYKEEVVIDDITYSCRYTILGVNMYVYSVDSSRDGVLFHQGVGEIFINPLLTEELQKKIVTMLGGHHE